MTESKRRTNECGKPMLVKLPTGNDWESSGEGGMAFFFCVKKDDRQVCCAGNVIWPPQDVCFNKDYDIDILSYTGEDLLCISMPIDCGMLIGSTGLSLWNECRGEYFKASYSDLTAEGKRAYAMLEKLYGKGCVDIVTLLDT